MDKKSQRQRALSKEQSKIRVLAIERILKDGKIHSTNDIQNILFAKYGIEVDRKTVYADIYAIDRFMPVCHVMGRNGGFVMEVRGG